MEIKESAELKILLKDFFTLTHMKICIYDSEGKEMSYYPERFCAFCGKLRENSQMDEKCRQSDAQAFANCRKTGRSQIYRCHAGLTECVAPVNVGGSIRGFIAIGQMRDEFSPLHPPVGSDGEYSCIAVTERGKIEAALHILEACAGFEHLKSFVEECTCSLSSRIEKYITENLTNDLSVKRLCMQFGVSGRELYGIFRREFGSTPAEYVKRARLEYGARLLKSTRFYVNRIAEKCGIGDYNYFTKQFRKVYGICPREYRKSSRANG